ncbi:hypothetical protein ABIA19_004717 [Sinorhizobium fredii]
MLLFAEIARHLARRIAVDIGEDDDVVAIPQATGDGTADVAGCARDDRYGFRHGMFLCHISLREAGDHRHPCAPPVAA